MCGQKGQKNDLEEFGQEVLSRVTLSQGVEAVTDDDKGTSVKQNTTQCYKLRFFVIFVLP